MDEPQRLPNGDGYESIAASQEERDTIQLPTPADSPTLKPLKNSIDAVITSSAHLDGAFKPVNGTIRRPSLSDRRNITSNGPSSETSQLRLNVLPKDERKRSNSTVGSPEPGDAEHLEKVQRLSPVQLEKLISEPLSLPIRAITALIPDIPPPDHTLSPIAENGPVTPVKVKEKEKEEERVGRPRLDADRRGMSMMNGVSSKSNGNTVESRPPLGSRKSSRPEMPPRTASTPPFVRRRRSNSRPQPLQDVTNQNKPNRAARPLSLNLKDLGDPGMLKPSPIPESTGLSPRIPLPLPPLSLHTFLQLELAADGPSPLYIHRAASADRTYESTEVIFERLRNFIGLPPYFEQVLLFGAIACLDAWLYIFTILPLRFLKALYIWMRWWPRNLVKEGLDLVDFVWRGLGRVWSRRNLDTESAAVTPLPLESDTGVTRHPSVTTPSIRLDTARDTNGSVYVWPDLPKRPRRSTYKHRRTRSTVSLLQASHKADLIKGLLVIISCWLLMYMDPSRMYHKIRGQSAIKLYVIYNLIEVGDRMLSAIGQDILEALFSRECLERGVDGRSKVIRPLWVFLMALAYNCAHAAALFYQVIALNVAVNSYSNALLTLLMSNQFVEIKGTVFKKFEKENLFQLTCADVVERFQLWLMLLIIALRNIVEVGGFNIISSNSFSAAASATASASSTNGTGLPVSAGSILPQAFTILPKWTGDVLAPFLIVLGSEMAVDWIKHCFVTKFNNVKPQIYGRFLDVLAKDYYVHAFADQDLTKRFGLPVFPLACLFIRASIQTYHMFLATLPSPLLNSAAKTTTLAEASLNQGEDSISGLLAAFTYTYNICLQHLGHPVPASGLQMIPPFLTTLSSTLDSLIPLLTTFFICLLAYLLLLSLKLLLGMLLLSYSRKRYKTMKDRAGNPTVTAGKRFGGWGVVEVEEEKRKWIYRDDPEALERIREREGKARREKERQMAGGGEGGMERIEGVRRYDMVAKRIW